VLGAQHITTPDHFRLASGSYVVEKHNTYMFVTVRVRRGRRGPVRRNALCSLVQDELEVSRDRRLVLEVSEGGLPEAARARDVDVGWLFGRGDVLVGSSGGDGHCAKVGAGQLS
jgi:hypothetical protein